ncbi:NAD-dependent epimerase/dehydratase family protein [Zooshikella sp. RANM57]|uniref:NAD-dependent epimerase/dehydratase family protein n=1 Tax=Zooshikella sp. RANM57 TaxID=3425863 RepID=UPI003D700675
MKILLVGGSSSLAQQLIPHLSCYADIITAGRHNCDIYLDLQNPEEKGIAHKIGDMTVLIHIAAYFGKSLKDDQEDVLKAETVNALGTYKACLLAEKLKAQHVIYISTIFTQLDDHSPFFNSYALSKRHGEELAAFFCAQYKIPLTILRPAQFYGSILCKRHQPFFYKLLDDVFLGKTITLYGTGKAKRNYIHIDDVVQVIDRVVKQRVTGTYQCLYPQNISYKELVQTAINVCQSNSRLIFNTQKADGFDNTFCYTPSLYQQIGFEPQITLADGIKDYLINHKNYG